MAHIDSLRGFLGVSVMCHHFIVWMSVKVEVGANRESHSPTS